MTDIVYRAPRAAELADCALIWHSATDDYMRRLNRPLPPPVLDPLVGLLEHFVTTDASRFIVAAHPEGPKKRDSLVGFGIALQRGDVWYLSQLYVLPEYQNRGIGRSMLRRILPAPEAATHNAVLATATDSAQPTSNGLYAALGIVPRMPLLNLAGRPIAHHAALPHGITATPFSAIGRVPGRSDLPSLADALEAVDTKVLGYPRSPDHCYFRDSGRVGFLYRDGTGAILGYGYSSPAGRFGPVALLDDALTGPVLAHLIKAVEPRGALSAWVPGANDRAIAALLRAGLRIEGFPALLCWTRPFAALDRYVAAGPALL